MTKEALRTNEFDDYDIVIPDKIDDSPEHQEQARKKIEILENEIAQIAKGYRAKQDT